MQTRAIAWGARLAAVGLVLAGGAAWGAVPQGGDREVAAEKEKQESTNAGQKETKRQDDSAGIDNQQPASTLPPGFKSLEKDFLLDQKQIWTSPARIRFSDTQWLVPLAGISAGLFVTDRDFSKHLSQNPSTLSHYKTVSDAGIAALVGGAGGMWLLGHASHNEHWSETGFLAGEAALNSLVLVESLKYSLRRERPFQGNGTGAFFQSGGTSFPSEHAAAAWSVAGVIAHEYPGPFTKILAYGLASLVDVSRVKARQHFSSDVLIGSAIGNLIAQDIYSRHHDPLLGGGEWRSLSQIFRGDEGSSPANHGSPYVPLDSWIYPALVRLEAMGVIHTGFLGMRPWTRNECARLLAEASDQIDGGVGGTEAEQTYRFLESEFRDELEGVDGKEFFRGRLESLYTRVTGISGKPLTDGYHFGQTIINDYGRPFQKGFNTVDGFSGWATGGHWVAYLRGEYEHAPSAPALPQSIRQFISSTNSVPSTPPPTPFAAVDSLQLLDAYVGMNFENWQVSFGKQSLWWGPSRGGPLMFNNDARPVNMFRVNRVSPFKLPSILGWLGPWRLELFVGQLAGHEFVFQTDTGIVGQFGRPLNRQPFIQGERFSFKPVRDFELGFSATVVFAGGPTPLTPHNYFRTFFASGGSGQGIPGSAADPGDGRSGLDFTLRVPGLRDWLTFYTEAFVEDEYSPIAYWRNSAIWSGLYLPRIPKLPKLDFRVESGYTDLPGNLQNGGPNPHYGPGIFYSNTRYPNGYTNDGYLLGNWMGRQSQGTQVWSTYRFSPRNFIQASYRHQKVSQLWMPGGATLNDFSIGAEYWVHRNWNISTSVQYEKWNFPLLAPSPQTNIATSVGITFAPFGGRLKGEK